MIPQKFHRLFAAEYRADDRDFSKETVDGIRGHDGTIEIDRILCKIDFTGCRNAQF